MSQPIVFTWLPSNVTYVAPTQTLTAAGRLQLNTSEGWAPGYVPTSYGPVTIPGFARVISITATSILSVTITGTDVNGQPQSEVLPTIIGIVYSVNLYHTVTSIVTNGAAANISAGIDVNSALTYSGISSYTLMDYYRGAFYGSVQLDNLAGATTFSCNILQSLDKPYIFPGDGRCIPNPNLVGTAPTGITNPLIAALGPTNLTTPITTLWLQVVSAGTTAAGNFVFTILQQGLK